MTHAFKRSLSDAELNERTARELYAFAAHCDVEPSEPDVCDACAAYRFAQQKDAEAKVESARVLAGRLRQIAGRINDGTFGGVIAADDLNAAAALLEDM